MKIINSQDKTMSMYWWSNIAVPEYEEGRICVGEDKAYTLKDMCVYKTDIPMVNGIDITNYNEIKA